MRSLRDLTQHLTTRADDSHAAPVHGLRRGADVSTSFPVHVKPRQGSSRCFELNHMLHRLCGHPSIPLSFSLATVLPGGVLITLATAPRGSLPPTPSTHRLRRGLPGYLILFAPHAVAHQRQQQPSWPPSPQMFFPISTHSTATPGIPPASTVLKLGSLEGSLTVEP